MAEGGAMGLNAGGTAELDTATSSTSCVLAMCRTASAPDRCLGHSCTPQEYFAGALQPCDTAWQAPGRLLGELPIAIAAVAPGCCLALPVTCASIDRWSQACWQSARSARTCCARLAARCPRPSSASSSSCRPGVRSSPVICSAHQDWPTFPSGEPNRDAGGQPSAAAPSGRLTRSG